ncbi:MAG: hypothetical protein LBU97_02855 [Alistipes sp.]|jgi:hypothetical protein|nr:hypothetical protein [Alistipes sp.]
MKKLIFFTLLAAAAAIVTACKNEPKEEPKELTLEEILWSAPVEPVQRDMLPGWINEEIDRFMDKPLTGTKIHIFKGELSGNVVYLVLNSLNSCRYCDYYYEDGEKPALGIDEAKNWVLTWEFVVGANTRSESMYDGEAIEDEYNFPKLSIEWGPEETIQSRLDALQIPDNVLSTISTAGLLETCLNFPYLIDILFSNDYQQGFEALLAEFNGFRELMIRSDLINALLVKYGRVGKEVAEIRMQSDVEKGRFSFRNFVLEMMLAQNVVIENLTEEQEKQLFKMSIEHTKTERSNPDIFGDLNALSTSLLYAKTTINDANGYTGKRSTVLASLIKAPSYVDQEIIKYLEDCVIAKYKISKP